MKLTTLALSNIRRNISKYIMYFFALSFSVFTTYSFLALIYSEQVYAAFNYSDSYRLMLISFGVIILVFVLFFLLSSNRSFIRARKKEISTYSLFGMTNKKLGRLLLLETMIIGLVALIVGIGLGVFFSKLTSMILLDMTLGSYASDVNFIFETNAIYITTMIFLLIFLAMGVSGYRVIGKFQLVDLFKSNKVSEIKPRGSTFILLLSLLLIGLGYYFAYTSCEEFIWGMAIPILLLVVSGTYLFFWGGLPKVIELIKKNKSKYYKGESLISTNAFLHRIRSIGSVMATIAVLAAVGTTAIATGFTLYRNAEVNTYSTYGYDLHYYSDNQGLTEELNAVFERNDTKIIDHYFTGIFYTVPDMECILMGNIEYLSSERDYFRVFSVSEYNKLLNLAKVDMDTVTVKPNEALYVRAYINQEFEELLKGHELIFSHGKITITELSKDILVPFNRRVMHTLVLADEDFQILLESGDILPGNAPHSEGDNTFLTVVNYENPLSSKKVHDELDNILRVPGSSFDIAYYHYTDALEIFGLICFIGFFMSAIFILMTASLLYFKQIMSAEEERHQYLVLRKIGMNRDVEKKVITKRLLPVFLIPLIVGITHSIFAMKTADTIVFSFIIQADKTYLTVLSLSFRMYIAYAVVYGLFYFVTKAQYSRIIN